MGRTIKHENMLQPNPGRGKEEYNYTEFICRGCNFGRREQILRNFLASTYADYNREIDNSYLMLVEEPENFYDPNAISVLCRGEFFGTVGYVGREYVETIKDILYRCDSYRVDLVDRHDPIGKNARMVVTWHE